MITRTEARELTQTLNDVFTPEGDAGVISRLWTFTTIGHEHHGKGQMAWVMGENVNGWFPITELESEATIRAARV